MDDLLTQLTEMGRLCTRHWQWVVAGICCLYLAWHRQATSVLPTRRGAVSRRYYES